MSNLISKISEGRVIEVVLESIMICYMVVVTGYGAWALSAGMNLSSIPMV